MSTLAVVQICMFLWLAISCGYLVSQMGRPHRNLIPLREKFVDWSLGSPAVFLAFFIGLHNYLPEDDNDKIQTIGMIPCFILGIAGWFGVGYLITLLLNYLH